MIFLILLFIPVLIALTFFFVFKKRITWKECLVHLGIQVAIAGISILVIYQMNVMDTETWNGTVTSKKSEHVHCRHSYSCNCHEVCTTHYDGKSSSQSCYTHCDTCYEHSYDVDWVVYSNIQNFTIDTIDRQGLKEPPRWTQVKIGEPVAVQHWFMNYIKGAKDTLFRKQGQVEKFKDKIPEYPGKVYDYYKEDRLVLVNVALPDKKVWIDALAELNGRVGYQKTCNVIIVLVRGLSREYFYALEQSWLGGKKNDIVLVIDMDNEEKINWVEVMAWTDNNLFKVKLRDDVLAVATLDREKIFTVLRDDILNFYKRKSMKDFTYLRASIMPTPLQLGIAFMIGAVSSLLVGIMFEREDIL